MKEIERFNLHLLENGTMDRPIFIMHYLTKENYHKFVKIKDEWLAVNIDTTGYPMYFHILGSIQMVKGYIVYTIRGAHDQVTFSLLTFEELINAKGEGIRLICEQIQALTDSLNSLNVIPFNSNEVWHMIVNLALSEHPEYIFGTVCKVMDQILIKLYHSKDDTFHVYRTPTSDSGKIMVQ